MSEQRAPFLARVLGRVGPAFGVRQDPWLASGLRDRAERALADDDGEDLDDLPAALLGRLDREVPRIPGLAAAILELGGLPEDEDLLKTPRSIRRRGLADARPDRRRGPPIADSRLPTLRQALPEPALSELASRMGRDYRLRRPQGKFAPTRMDDRPDLGVQEPPGWSMHPPVEPIGGGPIDDLARRCQLLSVPRPTLRYVWDRRRSWTFDLAWPHPRIAVVIDGGWRIGRRVIYGSGWIRDAERINEAVIDGWCVQRVTVAQIETGAALRLIARAFSSPWKRV